MNLAGAGLLTAYVAFILIPLTPLWAYARRFALKLGHGKDGISTHALLFSVPAFLNLACNQVNAILLVDVGEAMVSIRARHPLRAGCWLSLLAHKAQLLLPMLFLLLMAELRTVVLGAIGGLASHLLLFSMLAGFSGMLRWIELIFLYVSGLATNYPESIMNWRGFGILSQLLLKAKVAFSLQWAGMAATVIAALILAWHLRRQRSQSRIWLLLAGTLAHDNATAWHAHIHMALPLFLLLLLLVGRGERWQRLTLAWIFLPCAVFAMLGLVKGALIAHLAAGRIFLIFHLILLATAWITSPQHPFSLHEVEIENVRG